MEGSKKRSVKALEERIEEYFANCEEQNILPLKPDLLLYIDLSKEQYSLYSTPPNIDNTKYRYDIDYRRNIENRSRLYRALKKADLRMEAAISRQAVTSNKPTGAIFLLKQEDYGGYSDRQDYALKGGDVPITIQLKTSAGDDYSAPTKMDK